MSRRGRPSQAESMLEDELSESLLSQAGTHIDEKVNNLVRYLVINAGKNLLFRRAELAKLIGTKTGVQFQDAITQATNILKEVYGYNLLVDLEKNSSRAYILSNYMPYKNYTIDTTEASQNESDEEDDDDSTQTSGDAKNVLLLLILSHIFMSNGAVIEMSLHSFLKPLSITPEKRHPIFGHLKDCMEAFIKMKYLSVEVDPISKVATYSWGLRSEKEIKKTSILQFVCKMYGDRRPEFFVNHLKEAKEQCYENTGLSTPGTSMEVDADE